AQAHRLAAGGLIDRSRTLSFTFDGEDLIGHPGDTLASALLANGVRLVARSFKYHRPRGILTAGSEEPSALVELRSGARREPNTRATTIELYDGLDATSQNRWPSLKFDLLAVNQLFAPIFGAGFYYKTFMWPASFWEKVYEPAIRRAAGLGRAAGAPDPDHYEKANAFCDVLVIGGGPAGLSAALAAARSGARVILCDEDFRLGGRLLSERYEIDGRPAIEWVQSAKVELESLPDCRIMPRTTVVGVYDGGTYAAVERVNDHLPVPPEHEPRLRLWRIVAKRAVLAAGAIERPVVFGGNDRPGVMLAGAVRAYVNRFAVVPGARAVVFAASDEAFRTAEDLAEAGVEVAALVDARRGGSNSVRKAAEAARARYLDGGSITRVRGRQAVSGVEIARADGGTERLDCDLIAMSGGWNPTIHLTTHLNGKPQWNEQLAALLPGKLPPGMSVAGAAAGDYALGACLAGGQRAGAEAAASCGFSVKPSAVPAAKEEPLAASPLWQVANTRGKAFVDFQNDVAVSDVKLAVREGFRVPEHLKRYTTHGMATDQGKTAGLSGSAVLAQVTGRYIGAVGTTTFRPPYTPVAISAFAGHHRGPDFRPARLAPSHRWAEEQGAVFVETGPWLRAAYYPKPGEEAQAAVNREVANVREQVGICDVSTLGKIDVQGTDAGLFLDRVYANTFSTLPVGKARYGLMLREDGFVLDDGTTARLREDHYFVTTTTVNAVKVMQHLEFCQQCLWPELDVQMVSVTEQWAQFAVAGPRARDVLQRVIDPPHDISNEAFPYLAAGEVSVCGGTPARLFRLSFSGEMAYEIAVPSSFGDALVRAIMEAGAPFGIAPYGTEALGVLRIEKGHPAGAELNGQTTAHDLGMGKLLSAKKDFIGRFMAQRPALTDPLRPSLVGLKPIEAGARIRAGSHLLPQGAEATAANDQGYVTSAAFSPSLGHWLALGLLSRGPERHGDIVRVYDPVRGGDLLAEVRPPCFIDPEGARLRV
ncbi:sarcosine oxidase subunit alpha family protein, partial [Methyloceanibacter sp.]|uniref:sarcosine oxidase subunit alpha family protein n=1 Tax=Methyloceanibacter sp. TaxID=1965321 RepID=UPI002D576277